MPFVVIVTMLMSLVSCAWQSEDRPTAPPAPGSFSVVERTLTSDGVESAVTGAEVSEAFFESTGARPWLGRTLVTADFAPNGGHVILLHHDLWQRSFRGEPSVVGRQVTVDGHAATVVGVMPAAFNVPERSQFWVPGRRK
jgi:hypothetical protein